VLLRLEREIHILGHIGKFPHFPACDPTGKLSGTQVGDDASWEMAGQARIISARPTRATPKSAACSMLHGSCGIFNSGKV
jgi:hypothetical protein